jgi:hypothetical protein
MNWCRVLFWVWLIVTLGWWGYCFTESHVGCRVLAETDWQRVGCEYTTDRSALIAALLWPAVVFVLGWIVLRAIQGLGNR